jgi:hypothetical protein
MKEFSERLIFDKMKVKKLYDSVQTICNVTDFANVDFYTKVNIRANEERMIVTKAF